MAMCEQRTAAWWYTPSWFCCAMFVLGRWQQLLQGSIMHKFLGLFWRLHTPRFYKLPLGCIWCRTVATAAALVRFFFAVFLVLLVFAYCSRFPPGAQHLGKPLIAQSAKTLERQDQANPTLPRSSNGGPVSRSRLACKGTPHIHDRCVVAVKMYSRLENCC